MYPRRALLGILTLGLLGVLPLSAQEMQKKQEMKMEPKEVTITGEVVDTACFVTGGLKGAGHRDCAIACAKAGQGLAIWDEKTKTLYTILAGSPGDNPNARFLDHAAHMVTVKGKLYTAGNLKGLVVSSVEMAK